MPLLPLAFLLATAAPAAAAAPAVRAWEGVLELPTYEEGLPDVNPPFDVFRTGRFIYPYTLRENLTDRRAPRRWRALNLENEYLHCVVLPDLGGHVYSCRDKVSGEEMFYANTAIKLAQVAYRGAWAAFGIEFNFPVSHNWMTVSPVDFALVPHADGSASAWVANTDRVYGMRWRVEMTLRPSRAVLEMAVALDNPSDTRRRFYWWSNTALRVWDDSRIHYPQRFTASHGFTEVDTWPVGREGIDWSVAGNHRLGPVSLFSHGSREAFMGVYHPRTRAGAVHFSSPTDAPTKKFWSWGSDPDGLDWREALSDDSSAYVEVQAGLFRNQETYGFLEPQETIQFTEYWMPVREIGGITRANPEATLHLERSPAEGGAVGLAVGLNVYGPVKGGRLKLEDAGRPIASEPFELDPGRVYRKTFPGLPADRAYTVTLTDAAGRVLLRHTEGEFDLTPDEEIKTGPQPQRVYPPAERRSEGDFLRIGDDQEREGMLLAAHETYRQGRARFPESFLLDRAAGRLAVTLMRYQEGAELLARAARDVSNDSETQYYLGLALEALGRAREARIEWEKAQSFGTFRAPALTQLAQLEGRNGDPAAALARVRQALAEAPRSVRLGGLEVALLRRLGRTPEARERLRLWRALDPPSSFLRHEAVLLGASDAPLWSHLAGDPARVLDLATEYMGVGLLEDALALLERRYPAEGVHAEPGTALPQDHLEVAYYRGYVREALGRSGAADFEQASRLSTRFVFPSRPETFRVLRKADEVRPGDAVARFLLGSLHLAAGQADEARAAWEEARRIDRRLPVLHRNLGRTLLHLAGDVDAARAVFLEGMDVDPLNLDLYVGADQALSLLGRPAEERAAALRRHPEPLPPAIVQKLALALAEAGRLDEAEALFAGRFFPREEGGTNVREVFVEVRLLRALAEARRGRCAEALGLLAGLDRPVAGIDFTRDGLTSFTRGARALYAAGVVEEQCGRAEEARARWTEASRAADGLRGLRWAWQAARRLDGYDEAAWRERLQTALGQLELATAQGASVSRAAWHTQGLLLQALGRQEDARDRFRRALLLPDQRLSHHLSRRALAGAEPF